VNNITNKQLLLVLRTTRMSVIGLLGRLHHVMHHILMPNTIHTGRDWNPGFKIPRPE